MKNSNSTPDMLTETKMERIISFNTMPMVCYGDNDLDPGATVNTGETIRYTSSNMNVATIVNGKIQLLYPGVTIITAIVGTHPEETRATQILTVNKAEWASPAFWVLNNYPTPLNFKNNSHER